MRVPELPGTGKAAGRQSGFLSLSFNVPTDMLVPFVSPRPQGYIPLSAYMVATVGQTQFLTEVE